MQNQLTFWQRGGKAEIRLALQTLPFMVATAGSQTCAHGGSWETSPSKGGEDALTLREPEVEQTPQSSPGQLGGASSRIAVDQPEERMVPNAGKKWPNINAFSPRTLVLSSSVYISWSKFRSVEACLSARCSLPGPGPWKIVCINMHDQ